MVSGLLVLLLTITTLGLAQKQCYWPDGTLAPYQLPCNGDGSNSYCCGQDDVCLDNRYCLQTSGQWTARIGRGGCTDRTWEDSSCPSFCSDVATNDSTSLFLAYDTPNGAFCCHQNYNTSSQSCPESTKNSDQPFDLPAAKVIWDRNTGSTVLPTVATVTTMACPKDKSSNSDTAAVAAGIAAPLGALLIAALIAALIFQRRAALLRRELTKQQQQQQKQSQCDTAPPTWQQSPSTPFYQYQPFPQPQPVQELGSNPVRVEAEGDPVTKFGSAR